MNSLTRNERQNTAKTYRVILSAYEPLTIKEVAEAVSVGNDGEIHSHVDAEYIKRRCHNFITENEDGFLQFAHQSARLFFEKAEIHGDKDFVDVDDFSDTTNHREMAKICLQLMLRPDHRMWSHGQSDSVQRKGEFGLPKTLTKMEEQREYEMFEKWVERQGFSRYAFFYWVRHCRKLGSTSALGQVLSRELTKIIFEPTTAFSWWCRVMLDLVFKWAFRFGIFWDKIRETKNRHEAYLNLWRTGDEVSSCLQTAIRDSKNSSPHPLLAICAWNFAECLDQPQARHFLRVKEWPSIPQSPLHACSHFGSNQTLSRLTQYHPEKVLELIVKKDAKTKRNIPLWFAIIESDVNTTRSLLDFERAQSMHQGCWSSRQLSSLGSLCDMISVLNTADTILMVGILLEFEANQTGAHFPQRHGECWISDLAQQSTSDWPTPLEYAARFADAKVVALLLQAGAKSPTKNSALARALRRRDEQGPNVVDVLLSQDPAVCGTATDEDFVSFLGWSPSKRIAMHILEKRPELARMRTSGGETALMRAQRIPTWIREDPVRVSNRQNSIRLLEETQ